MSRPLTFFIAGTDTGVGKTLASCALLQAANTAGLSTVALKPVAAGCEDSGEGLRNEDALALQQYASLELSYPEVNPLALKLAVAPHIAAEQEGRRPSVDRLSGLCRGVMARRADLTLIEGAGGWQVPLNQREYLSDLAIDLKLPVILVVGVRLGCISHALLSARAIRADGLRLVGWIANCVDEDMPFAAANIQSIADRLEAPRLATLPWDPVDPVATAARTMGSKVFEMLRSRP